MRGLLLAAVCTILSGCLGLGREDKAEAVEAGKPPTVRPDCYTVELFEEAKIEKPDKSVPEAYRAFLGNWGKGAWNGVWCHDLLVTKVQKDGLVELYEMHAPYAPWGQPATAYKRIARIDKDGNLRFAYGTETLSYRIVNGRLEGTRRGILGNLAVSLARRGVPPVPVPRYDGRPAPGTPETVLAAADSGAAPVQLASAPPTAAPVATVPPPAGRPTAGRALPGQPAAPEPAAPLPAAPEPAQVQIAGAVPMPVPRATETLPTLTAPAGADGLPPVPPPRPRGFVRAQAQAMVAPGI